MRKYFLAVDYDVMDGYGLILERGVGVYDLKDGIGGNKGKGEKGMVWYLEEDNMTAMGITWPYKYARILRLERRRNEEGIMEMVIEVANSLNSY